MSQSHPGFTNRKMKRALRRGNVVMASWYQERRLDRMYGI